MIEQRADRLVPDDERHGELRAVALARAQSLFTMQRIGLDVAAVVAAAGSSTTWPIMLSSEREAPRRRRPAAPTSAASSRPVDGDQVSDSLVLVHQVQPGQVGAEQVGAAWITNCWTRSTSRLSVTRRLSSARRLLRLARVVGLLERRAFSMATARCGVSSSRNATCSAVNARRPRR